MRCRQLRKKTTRLAGVVAVATLLWWYSQPPIQEPASTEIHELPAPHKKPLQKKPLQPQSHPAKPLFVERGVTCAGTGSPTEGRVFHLVAENVSAEKCVERCRVEETCTIFTWQHAPGNESIGSCWYRIGGRNGAWLGRHAAPNSVSGCSIAAVTGCDPEQPYQLKEVLHKKDVAQVNTPDADSLIHPACPEPFRKRWTAGSTTLMLELLDQLHSELEELRVPYSLFGPTLLGQIRHGGFIPWQVGQAQIVIRHVDIGAVRHQLEPEIASKTTGAGGLYHSTEGKGLRPWKVSDKKTGFRLKFADEKQHDLHRSFFVDVFVVGGNDAFSTQGPADLLSPRAVELAPFHSRMYRVSLNKWALLELSGIARCVAVFVLANRCNSWRISLHYRRIPRI